MKKAVIFALSLLVSQACLAAIEVKRWEDLSDKNISPSGKAALSLDPEKWQHAETEHFVYHFTNPKEAETVYVHAEVYYEWVKKLFGVEQDAWSRKAHIFVFPDKQQWTQFLNRAQPRLQGDAFTDGWELFIYRDPFWLSPMKTMAHEITHVILFRFLDGPIPLFLNEGFAEFVSYRALAMQLGRSEFEIRTVQLLKADEFIPLNELISMTAYPDNKVPVFYQQSELFARYFLLSYDSKLFYRFLRQVSKGQDVLRSIEEIYGLDRDSVREKFHSYAVSK